MLRVSVLSYPEAAVIGLLQGVTELFPVSSLGHSVLLPALIGGAWGRDLSVNTPESPYLAFIVGLHVATAIALIIFFWRDWIRIVRGFATSIRGVSNGGRTEQRYGTKTRRRCASNGTRTASEKIFSSWATSRVIRSFEKITTA